MKKNDFNKEIEVWKRAGKREEQDVPNISKVHISSKKRLNTIVGKIKRNFVYECVVVVIALVFVWIISLSGIYDIAFNICLAGLTVATIVMAVYFHRAMFSVKQNDYSGKHLKDGIKSVIEQADQCVKIYKQAQKLCGYVFLPIVIFLAYRLMYVSQTAQQDIPLTDHIFTKPSLIFLVASILLIVFYYKLVDIYIKVLYGKHINSLKKLLQELNDEK